MEKVETREGFFKHREHELQKTPILRSSAVFYVLQSGAVSTEILLFNYWFHKRGVKDLTLVLTLRDIGGLVVYRGSELISFMGARTVTVTELLQYVGRSSESFEGALEIEVLSSVNLHIPYPAVVVRYHGAGWHSTAHSYSRFLSESSGDSVERIKAVQLTCEGNWTVHADPGLDTFFVVHNGPCPIEPHEMRLALTNHRGERLEATLPDISYMPRETRRFFPGRHMDVTGHLDGKPGCLEIATRVGGVFPRMLCGHVRATDGALSVDHSNFNYTGQAGLQDCLPTSEAGTRKPLGFVVPTLADTDWSCWADFYPTYPDRGYSGKFVVRAADGHEVARSAAIIGETERSGIVRVPISDLVAPHDERGAVDFTITHPDRVPTRFHMGIHYRYRNGLPAFLIDGPMPYTAAGVRSRWFPALFGVDTRTLLLISNQVFDSDAATNLCYEVEVHNSRAGKPLHERFELPAGATLAQDLREFIPGIEAFLGGDAGWVVLKADQPALSVVHYMMLKGKDSLAVDHAF
jgi:hypothetical protein